MQGFHYHFGDPHHCDCDHSYMEDEYDCGDSDYGHDPGDNLESTDDSDLLDKGEVDDDDNSRDDFDNEDDRGKPSLGALCLCQMTSNHSAPPTLPFNPSRG